MNLLLGIVKILKSKKIKLINDNFTLILIFLCSFILVLSIYMLLYDFIIISFYINNSEENYFYKLTLIAVVGFIFSISFNCLKNWAKNLICLFVIILTFNITYKHDDYLIMITKNKYKYIKEKIIDKDIDVINLKLYKDFLIDKEKLELSKIKNYMEIENIYSNFERSINKNLIGLNNENKIISIKLKDYIIKSLKINHLDKKRLLKKYEDNFISEIEFKEIVLEINKIIYSGQGNKNE